MGARAQLATALSAWLDGAAAVCQAAARWRGIGVSVGRGAVKAAWTVWRDATRLTSLITTLGARVQQAVVRGAL
eukprot:scaffold70283_cov42-Phaeocystis_antarctica.AAC.1